MYRMFSVAGLLTCTSLSLAGAREVECADAFFVGNWATAAQLCPAEAEADDWLSQYLLASMYENGFGVEQDFNLALSWYLRSLQSGGQVHYNIGGFYYDGRGVRQDFVEALHWLSQAAEYDSRANFPLGEIFYRGLAGEQDYIRAINYYLQGASSGDLDASYMAGTMLYDGHGTFRGVSLYDAAYLYFTYSAERGHAGAQVKVAIMLFEGLGVEQDSSEGFRWLSLAAGQGDPQAHYGLGLAHAEGLGTPQNYISAYMWFNIASVAGHELAVSRRDAIASRLNSEHLVQAQERARRCVSSSYGDC
jgi:uncharacterized protein